MPKVELPIANGFYESESLPISAQRCINWYPNIPQTQGLSEATLFGTPGINQLASTGVLNQVNRGAHTMAGIPYFVNGNELWRLNRSVDADLVESFSIDSLGAIEGSGLVSIADNGTQMLIQVPGGKGYIWNHVTEALTEITDPDFTANGNPQIVVFLDGYFVLTTDSKKFIISALNDGLSYNALDFGSAEADPDDIVGAVVHSNQLYIFGSETIEAFRNIGGADFPFQRVNGFVIPKGLSAPFAVTRASNTFMFVGAGQDEFPAIWQFTGNGVEKVSTTAIDNVLQGLMPEDIQSIFAGSYAQKGAYFVGFSIPGFTLAYDTITGRWHERQSNIDGDLLEWRVRGLTTAYNRVLVGDAFDGRIGELSTDVYTEYGAAIVRIVTTQPFANLGDPIYVGALEATMEAGVGNGVEEPQVRLSWSDDAKRFNNELSRSIGKIGEYNRRSTWRRLGRIPRYRVLKFVMSDAVKPVFIKLEANIA